MKKAAFIFALMLTGCAGAPSESTAPEWLDGSSKQYPEVRYLLGKGQGDSGALARDHARAELAKVFSLHVSEQARDTASAEVTTEQGVAHQRSETRAERSVHTQAQRVLENVRIADTWRDPAGVYHALAVLDRLTEGERLRQAIAGLDQVVEGAVNRARDGNALLPRIGAAAQAVRAQSERDALQRDLRVIDITGIGVPARYETARLDADFAALAARLKLAGASEQEQSGNLVSVLQGAIRHAGFVNAGAGEADYRLTTTLNLETVKTGGWDWATGTLELRMTDKSGQAIGTARWPVKASAQQEAVAHQRAIAEAERVLRENLRETVIGFSKGM